MPRSLWSGTKFHFLHKGDLAPVGYDKVRKDTGEHVDLMAALRESVARTTPAR
jgi:non-homologous end joining protein Ku